MTIEEAIKLEEKMQKALKPAHDIVSQLSPHVQIMESLTEKSVVSQVSESLNQVNKIGKELSAVSQFYEIFNPWEKIWKDLSVISQVDKTLNPLDELLKGQSSIWRYDKILNPLGDIFKNQSSVLQFSKTLNPLDELLKGQSSIWQYDKILNPLGDIFKNQSSVLQFSKTLNPLDELLKEQSSIWHFNKTLNSLTETMGGYSQTINKLDNLNVQVKEVIETPQYAASSNVISPSKLELFSYLKNSKEIPKYLYQEFFENIGDIFKINILTTEEEIKMMTDSLGISLSEDISNDCVESIDIKNYFPNFKLNANTKKLMSTLIFMLIMFYNCNQELKYAKEINCVLLVIQHLFDTYIKE